jgi:hypothetical protein
MSTSQFKSSSKVKGVAAIISKSPKKKNKEV